MTKNLVLCSDDIAGVSFEEVKRIKEEFQEEDFFKKLLSECINTCGISEVGIYDKNAPASQKDNFCIYVGLLSRLPSRFQLPRKYKGVRVFTEVIGEIRSL